MVKLHLNFWRSFFFGPDWAYWCLEATNVNFFLTELADTEQFLDQQVLSFFLPPYTQVIFLNK